MKIFCASGGASLSLGSATAPDSVKMALRPSLPDAKFIEIQVVVKKHT